MHNNYVYFIVIEVKNTIYTTSLLLLILWCVCVRVRVRVRARARVRVCVCVCVCEDQQRAVCPNNFEDAELEALLNEDPCQTQEETAIDVFKPSIEGKTATIWAEAQQSNFAAQQRSTSCRTGREKILLNVEMGSPTPPAV